MHCTGIGLTHHPTLDHYRVPEHPGDPKRFAILRSPYRNRTKRFTLRFNLIAALHNQHL